MVDIANSNRSFLGSLRSRRMTSGWVHRVLWSPEARDQGQQRSSPGLKPSHASLCFKGLKALAPSEFEPTGTCHQLFFCAGQAGLVEVEFALDAAEDCVVDAALVAEADGGLAFDTEHFEREVEEAAVEDRFFVVCCLA